MHHAGAPTRCVQAPAPRVRPASRPAHHLVPPTPSTHCTTSCGVHRWSPWRTPTWTPRMALNNERVGLCLGLRTWWATTSCTCGGLTRWPKNPGPGLFACGEVGLDTASGLCIQMEEGLALGCSGLVGLPGLMHCGLLRLRLSFGPLSALALSPGLSEIHLPLYKMRYSHLPRKVSGKTRVSSCSEKNT